MRDDPNCRFHGPASTLMRVLRLDRATLAWLGALRMGAMMACCQGHKLLLALLQEAHLFDLLQELSASNLVYHDLSDVH